MAAPERLSLNQITTAGWSLEQAVEGCVRHGVRSIAPWRDRVAEVGVQRAAQLVRDAGLHVSSLCRGGFLTGATAAQRADAEHENRSAIEEAAALRADCLVMVCGPPVGRDLAGARDAIAHGLERLVPHAREAGVKLAIEPLHPMMIGERSAIVTLDEATTQALRFDVADVGVIVDAYHLWWDPELEHAIARAGRRILGYHVSDWLVPTTSMLQGRGMMGDGIIDLATIGGWVEEAGYDGPIEVEIISAEHAGRDGDELLALTCERFAATV